MFPIRTLGAALALAFALSPLAATAQQSATPADENPVVARVNGEDVLRSEVFEMAQSLPPQYQSQLAQIYPLLVQRVVDFRLAERAGRAAGLAEDSEVEARIAKAVGRVIRDTYLERAVNARVTDERMQESYKAFLAKTPAKTEQRARHILLKTEEEAKAVIKELDAGADFAELAKTRSTGPSAAKGGDLGYFTDDQMVPEFAAAATAMEPGQHSAVPVKTQFGWHVIKLEDRRVVAPPTFEEVASQLREEASRAAVEDVLKTLRAGAQVEILPAGLSIDGAAAPAQ